MIEVLSLHRLISKWLMGCYAEMSQQQQMIDNLHGGVELG